MNYRSATNYLNNYINFEVKPATAYAPEKFNLNRVHNIIKRIGSPHLQYPSVHIAGTKGKGIGDQIHGSRNRTVYLTSFVRFTRTYTS